MRAVRRMRIAEADQSIFFGQDADGSRPTFAYYELPYVSNRFKVTYYMDFPSHHYNIGWEDRRSGEVIPAGFVADNTINDAEVYPIFSHEELLTSIAQDTNGKTRDMVLEVRRVYQETEGMCITEMMRYFGEHLPFIGDDDWEFPLVRYFELVPFPKIIFSVQRGYHKRNMPDGLMHYVEFRADLKVADARSITSCLYNVFPDGTFRQLGLNQGEFRQLKGTSIASMDDMDFIDAILKANKEDYSSRFIRPALLEGVRKFKIDQILPTL